MSIKISDQGLLKTQAYIDGKWVDADSGETLPVTNPANGEVLAEVAKCSADRRTPTVRRRRTTGRTKGEFP